MMEPIRVTLEDVQEYFDRMMKHVCEIPVNDAELIFVESMSHPEQLEFRLSFNGLPQAFEGTESDYVEKFAEFLAHQVRMLHGTIRVFLWYRDLSKEEPQFKLCYTEVERKFDPYDLQILYSDGRSWALRELFEIQFWADLAYAGMHSNAAVGMSVGGRRFRWLQVVHGFTRDEAEVLARLSFADGTLRRLPNGMYIGSPGKVAPCRRSLDWS